MLFHLKQNRFERECHLNVRLVRTVGHSNGRSFERRTLLDSRIKKAAQGPPLQIGSIRCELSGRSFIPTSYLQPVSRRGGLGGLLGGGAQRVAIAAYFRRACLP